MIHSDGFLMLVDDAKTSIREVTVKEVRAKQSSKRPFHFVDVREDLECAKGGAAGSSIWARVSSSVILR